MPDLRGRYQRTIRHHHAQRRSAPPPAQGRRKTSGSTAIGGTAARASGAPRRSGRRTRDRDAGNRAGQRSPSAASRATPASSAVSMRPRTWVPNPACTSVRTIKRGNRQRRASVPGLHPPHPSCTRYERRVQQQLHDHDRDDQMRRDDPRRELVSDDAAAEPAFEANQQKRRDRRPQDSRLMPMMAPRRDRGGENQEADGDAEQTVQVLRPHQRRD